MQPFWRSQFDKSLMAVMFLLMCGLAVFATNDKVVMFALTSASSIVGCLLTLVTGRRPAASDTLMDPTSTETTSSTTTKSIAGKDNKDG